MIVSPTLEKLRQEDKEVWKFRASLDLAKKDKDEDEKRKEEKETEAGQEEGGEKRERIWWHSN